MENFPQNSCEAISRTRFYLARAITAFILLLPLFFLTVPAIAFSRKAKKYYSAGNTVLSDKYTDLTKRCVNSAWAIAFILIITSFALHFISHLSLI